MQNNPARYNDPSGHMLWEGDDGDSPPPNIIDKLEDYGLLNPLIPYYMVPVFLGTLQKAGINLPLMKSSESLQMTADWYWECGEKYREFGIESEITQALILDEGVGMARKEYINNGIVSMVGSEDRYRYHFGLLDAVREFGDVVREGDWSTSFLGGYYVEIENINETEAYNLVEFRVLNETSWESATRVWNYFFKQSEFRSEPGPGGTMKQVYIWHERISK